ncbi:MAG: UDP-N-acetylmuramoyl-tripeptide--D-alanyl-D-alanine ligase [Actinomycetota bacterium]|nr:UDP-N-acetylmuramoyl-tripeptide--D-alanyl-D-alanine ligase [Actinomycetota bacterium]
MKPWTATQVAAAAGARLISGPRGVAGARLISEPPTTTPGPERASIDSRDTGPGALFVGLPGANADGGRFAAQALGAGAWGILATEEHAQAAKGSGPGVLLAAEDPLKALQRLATAWRRELNAQVIGVTGSTGKTSTKELLRAVIEPHRRTVASRANFNTEIGLPLEILAAPAGTEVLVLEMGMRGAGQIAELAGIAEPDVGVIVSIGPVHLELLGSLEAIAATKAELIAALAPGATAVLPAGEPLLAPHHRADLRTLTFGEGGDVRMRVARGERVEIDLAGEAITLEVSFAQAHLRRNLLAAVAAASAIGVRASGRVDLEISAGRGARLQLGSGITLIDDCYNANPMSMRAALDELAAAPIGGEGARRVAVLGDMLELGPDERRFHVEIGEHARAVGVDRLVTVGPLAASIAEGFRQSCASHLTADAAEAAALVPGLLKPGDVVLVKASRGVGLERVCDVVRSGVPV